MKPEQLHKLKVEKLLDLIRRACANGTAIEVASAIAVDWSPMIHIDRNGELEILVSRNLS